MLLTLVPCVSADAAAPSWDETKEWAYGGKTYLDIRPGTDQYDLLTAIMAYVSNVQLNSINMNGSVESYLYISVDNASGDNFIVSVIIGAMSEVTADVSIDATLTPMVDGILSAPVTKTIMASADFDLTYYSSMKLKVDKTTYAIESMTAMHRTNISVSVRGYNIPIISSNGTTQFRNFNVKMVTDTAMNMSARFTPSLDLFQFPISSNEKWYASSTMNMTGNVSGSLKVTGLDDDILNLFSLGALNSTVDLSTFTGEYYGYGLTNGSFGPYDVPISVKMGCSGTQQVTMPDNRTFEAYIINVNEYSLGSPEFVLYYIPELGFMSSVKATTEVLDEIDLSGNANMTMIRNMVQLNFEQDLSMNAMAPSDAAQKIESITGMDVQTKDPAAATNNDNGQMFIIITVLAVVAIVAVMAVLLIRRGKK
ncbi:MAG: hypothetical protein A4E32_02149 [Methanomassiliicoccales archaeon PtaU1.Bin124]|nr:MAG: hypothetical protein A4E32_02149 [Methanomassiliicoccales archaeon PtaU1.Bin124]